MSRGPSFDDLFGDAPPDDRDRLRRAHELLVAAGPPPELPPSLADPPGKPSKRPARAPLLTTLPRRRLGVVVTAAVAASTVAFAIGYLAGRDDPAAPPEAGFQAVRALTMRGTKEAPRATALLRIGRRDDDGNRPMALTASGLERLPRGGYYELYLSKNGKPKVSCGTFVTDDETLTVRLNAAYSREDFDGWIVTRQVPGGPEDGPVVLTT